MTEDTERIKQIFNDEIEKLIEDEPSGYVFWMFRLRNRVLAELGVDATDDIPLAVIKNWPDAATILKGE